MFALSVGFSVRKLGITKMRKLPHTHNYSKILPNFIELLWFGMNSVQKCFS